MIWDAFRAGNAGPGLETMIGHVAEMLGHARHIFDEAMSALLAGAEPSALADDIFGTDRRINEARGASRARRPHPTGPATSRPSSSS